MSRSSATTWLEKLPLRFCNFDRLLDSMDRIGLDGIVLHVRENIFYMTGLLPMAQHADEPVTAYFLLSRRAPDSPILVVPDLHLAYFLSRPTWVEDIRPYRSAILPLDVPVEDDSVDRFLPSEPPDLSWLQKARAGYAASSQPLLRKALEELGLDRGRVAFDDFRLAHRLGYPMTDLVDGHTFMRHVRQIKTDFEIALLREATLLNQGAIERAVASWDEGMTWKDLNHSYHSAVVDLGGYVQDPGGIVIANPVDPGRPVLMSVGVEDFELQPGSNIMFDCHGSIAGYCWDGGKTWRVGEAPEG